MVEPIKKDFNYSVNGFRGLCVFFVFIFHIENSGIVPPLSGLLYDYIHYFISTFKYGVEMFFMISGYVIIGSLKRHETAKSFLIDRVLRIYPTWIPLQVLAFTVGPILKRGIFSEYNPLYWAATFFSTLFFLPTIFPFELVHPAAWSLSYEWCFYMIAALAAFTLPKAIKPNLIMLMVLMIAALLINFYPRGLFFIPGVIVALYQEKIRTHAALLKFPFIALLLFLFAWRGTNVDEASLDTFISEWIFDQRIVYATLAFLAAVYMFSGIVLNLGWLSKFLSIPFMQFYGKISYAFYLWSGVAMMVCKIIAVKLSPSIGEWGALSFFAVASFLVVTMISWLNWLAIETYLTNLLKPLLRSEKIQHAR